MCVIDYCLIYNRKMLHVFDTGILEKKYRDNRRGYFNQRPSFLEKSVKATIKDKKPPNDTQAILCLTFLTNVAPLNYN